MNKATVASLKACHLKKIETELTNITQVTMPEKKNHGTYTKDCDGMTVCCTFHWAPTVSFHKLFLI